MTHKISRRSAIGATVAGLTAVHGSLTKSLSAAESPNEKLNLAFIGVGGRGEANVKGLKRQNFVAFADVDESRAAGSFRAFPKARKFVDYRKMLDAVGDLALAGAPIIGRYIGDRSGHTMTNTLLRALFLDPTAYVIEDCSQELADRLPGAHISAEDLQLVA